MELSKKTTILFSPELHDQLSRLAEQRGVSLGELVRSACAKQYGIVHNEARVEAVRELAQLSLPVADVQAMKRQSVPRPDDLIP